MVDLNVLLHPFIISIICILFIIFIGFLESPMFKGFIGEHIVNTIIKNNFDINDYQLIKNVTLKTHSSTTQIDHILVSVYGIFVIETKNFKGWIFGSENQQNWTQKIYSKSYKFQNPLHQNFKHIKTLQELTELPIELFHSIIFFAGEATVKSSLPNNIVNNKSELVAFINSHKERSLTHSQMFKIIDQIQSNSLEETWENKSKHTNNVRIVIQDKRHSKEYNIENQLCDKCGSKMLIRTARQGKNLGSKFWGCSNFPKCRFTRKLDI